MIKYIFFAISLLLSLSEVTGKEVTEKHGPAAPGEQMRSVITSEKLFNKFKWKPDTELYNGLQKTADFFRNNLN